jgi:hypothetical protein
VILKGLSLSQQEIAVLPVPGSATSQGPEPRAAGDDHDAYANALSKAFSGNPGEQTPDAGWYDVEDRVL